MKKLLHVIATPRGDDSRTLRITEAFLESFQATHPDWVIEELNLTTEELPSLNTRRVDGKYVLLGGNELYGSLREAWQEIISHIERFLSADAYLISTPMWNFSIPYVLKHYIDIIVQPRYLFRYTEAGVEGLAQNRKMVVITSRGGQYTSDEMRPFDYQEPYLRMIFGYVGIRDIEFIIAQPTDMGTELQEEAIARARVKAKALAVRF
ncbi:MAG: NAD(P)H-dependent oxidoreductase [Nitrospirae bacterium]|nr:NAD(P)H-dependent oxidoreductase [Nitrospirota bacterium]